ncbi:MAG: hypothetical protein LBH18_02025 [Spirochaetaceae bacterium]|jgi:hypothetical protein|nr:hypothetical protein [Spirochaetaceae bacterium]
MTDLTREFPVIERARGFRLYGGGGRFVDLWQCGGAALMGHKPANVVRNMKNAAERGLFAPFPNPEAGRFTRVLGRLFPGRTFGVFSSQADVPAYKKLPVWRPFCSKSSELVLKGRAFRPVLPFPLAPAVVVNGKNCVKSFSGGFISPVILAAAARAVYDMLARPERGTMRFNSIKRAFELPETQKNWRLDGIYIYPARSVSTVWPAVFRRFMAGGFLLPPCPDNPIILPDELSKGEESALAGLFCLS